MMETMDLSARGALAGKTYLIRTFGCQMNLHDSERVSGLLDSYGALEVAAPEDADIVVFMTCCVREAADQRLYGQCNSMKSLPTAPSGRRVIAVGGCIAQRDGDGLLVNVDNVDVIFGTHAIARVADLISQAFIDGERHVLIDEEGIAPATDMPWHRATSYHAWVPIMTGCNNFCSYCIVPYVRGREKSRPMEEVVDEVTGLVRTGVREVTLLGQNVNSYGKNLEQPVTFAELLSEVVKIEGIRRVRFMTSHPKDLSDELIAVMRDCPKICRHLHLPLQSGSSRILKAMNRVYDKEQYLALAAKIQKEIPDLSLTTDIIVGFPGETEEDFQETLDVVRKVRYDSAFTFIYSKRTGTPAAAMEDQVPEPVVKDRFDRLLKEVQKISAERCRKDVGKTLDALVEGMDTHDPALVTGRLSNNIMVHFPGTGEDIGKILPVKLLESKGFYYMGERV